jgi:hypothetical protein
VAYDQQLADRVRELISGEAGLTEKKMFGGLAFLVNGNMAVAASGQGGPLVRVDPGDSAAWWLAPRRSPWRCEAGPWPGGCEFPPRG